MDNKILSSYIINTPIGQMIALADNQVLYLLQFNDAKNVTATIQKLLKKYNATFQEGTTPIIAKVQQQLHLYFQKKLANFSIPLHFTGTKFQQHAWQTLQSIPYGQTISYSEQSLRMNKPTSHRAVAGANGTNLIAIIIPCHRVIRKDNNLSGYNGGTDRKQWLLNHEKITR